MKKFSLIVITGAALISNSFGQGARLQPGFNPTPVPIYNISQIVSNILFILGTNFNIGGITITNLTRTNFVSNTDYFPIANTNRTGTNVNMRISYQDLVAQLSAVIAPSFPWVIITNGSSTATIQAAFNSITNGVIAFQNGSPYNVTATIWLTNFSGVVQGDGATLRFANGVTNAMMDTGTNYGKSIVIQDLRFDGGTYLPFNTTNYFAATSFGIVLDPDPYFNPFWTNRTGLRMEFSGGVLIKNCYFYGWSGNGCVFMSTKKGSQFGYPKLMFVNNYCYTNFQGVLLCASHEDTQSYYNNNVTGIGDWQAEYAYLSGNDFNNNQLAVSAAPGNVVISDNFIDENWIALEAVGKDNNSTHGRYQNNSFNHNTIAIYFVKCNGGMFNGNFFGRNGQGLGGVGNVDITYPYNSMSGLIFDKVTDINMTGNSFSREWLTFTNYSTGVFMNNTYGGYNVGENDIGVNDTNVVWGTTNYGIPTNFCSTMIVRGNLNILGGMNDDGSGARVVANTNIWPPTFGSLNATSTNSVWQYPSNSVPPRWWFGHFDASSNVVFDGHF